MNTIASDLPPVGLLRRLGAIVYDSLLLFSVLLAATALAYPIAKGQEASFIFRFYLLTVSFLYFAWPWSHGGQTLGMSAWRIQLRSTVTDHSVTWRQLLIRFLMAILSWAACGLGFLWALGNPQQLTWHDSVSKTRLVYLPKTS